MTEITITTSDTELIQILESILRQHTDKDYVIVKSRKNVPDLAVVLNEMRENYLDI